MGGAPPVSAFMKLRRANIVELFSHAAPPGQPATFGGSNSTCPREASWPPPCPRPGPGESKEFPLTFFVDPAIVDEPGARDLGEITLSYTFYNSGESPAPAPRQANKQGS